MFQDETFETASFQSCWKKDRETREASTQTSEILTYEAEVQYSFTVEVASQTASTEPREFALAECDEPSLLAFLKRVEEAVCTQLIRNVESRAFEDYDVVWEEPVPMVSCIHRLADKQMLDNKYCATDVSWNSTGSALAVSFGHVDHQSWCTHAGHVCVWFLEQRGLDPSKASVSIESPSCAMSVACHPTQPALLASGTFSGEVCVWSIASDTDQLVAHSGLCHNGHHEPVSRVTWIEDTQLKKLQFNLMSLGTDGKVLIWQLSQFSKQLQLVMGFQVQHEVSLRKMDTSHKQTEIGATCLGFSLEDKNLFVVGGENGGIFKCTLNSHLPEATPTNEVDDVQFPNPVTFSFKPHHGPVYSTSPSPFHRNLFLTCSTDSTARIYSFLETDPLLTLEPSCGFLYASVWSTTRPLVFALGTQQGKLLVYDLKKNQVGPVEVLQVEDNTLGPVLGLQFNAKRPQVLAAGHVTGHVIVWRLSSQLASFQQGEEKILDDIANQALAL